MVHETPRQITRFEGHKDTVGMRCCRWSIINYIGTKPGQTQMGMENAHFDLYIAPVEFDAVAGELADTLDYFLVPEKEKNEVLSAFSAHKSEVLTGYYDASKK